MCVVNIFIFILLSTYCSACHNDDINNSRDAMRKGKWQLELVLSRRKNVVSRLRIITIDLSPFELWYLQMCIFDVKNFALLVVNKFMHEKSDTRIILLCHV